MRARLRSLEQLMPFATAGELIAQKDRPPVSVSPDATALAALRDMETNDIGFLLVNEADKLVGVVSERDIARGAILHHHTTVRQIMSTRVHTVAPQTKLPECMRLMHREHIRHLPVVSDAGVLGVLSVRDLTGALIDRQERLLRRLHEERAALLFPYPSSY
ncbi:MAG: CBS domain-containing protein [Burkholderiales bacterium]